MYPLRDGAFQVYDLSGQHAHVPFQRETLAQSIRFIPAAFLGRDIPFGNEEPSGVVRVPLALDRFVSQTVHDLCLSEPSYLAFVASRWREESFKLRNGLSRCRSVPASSRPWAALVTQLARTGAFAALNWLTPNQDIIERLTELLTPHLGRGRNALELMVPFSLPLALRMRIAQVETMSKVTKLGEPLASQAIARYVLDWGCLVFEPFEAPAEERMAALGSHISDLLETKPDELTARQREARHLTRLHRERARSRREATDHVISGIRSLSDRLWARAAVRFMSFVAEEEEERHILRSRALALLEKRAAETGVAYEDCDTYALIEGGANRHADPVTGTYPVSQERRE